jgi:uncharacterized protein
VSGAGAAGDLVGPAVGFAHTLRAAGVDASPERVHAFLGALAELGASAAADVYWAGRVTLCADADELERYDRVFAAFFAGTAVSGRPRTHRRVQLGSETVSSSPAGAADDDAPTVTTVTREASARELLRHRDVTTLDAVERAELHRLLTAFTLTGEQRRSRRRSPAGRGEVDRRRTVRRMLRGGGEPSALRREDPRHRPRRVVLLLDVSGSMAGYADALLRFAHAAARGRSSATEVFTLGTRLTRVTEELQHRDPDTAMRAVSAAIPDWSGGTRLADTLREFLDRFGHRGLARGAIVVVLSDGWETGDARALGDEMARLARLAHRIVWANPRAGRAGFEPTAAGMAAALPWCDQLVEGHSLAALEHLAAVVAASSLETRGAGRDAARRRTVTASIVAATAPPAARPDGPVATTGAGGTRRA